MNDVLTDERMSVSVPVNRKLKRLTRDANFGSF